MIYSIMGIVLLGVGLLWLCFLGESAFVREAPYDVEIPEAPELRGKLYSLKRQQYLLAVYIPGTSVRKGFTVDLSARKIGMPDFSLYRRLGRLALVDKRTLLGYEELHCGLIADFETSGDRWVIKVTGNNFDPNFTHPRTRSFLEEELIFEKRVVLTPRHTGDGVSRGETRVSPRIKR